MNSGEENGKHNGGREGLSGRLGLYGNNFPELSSRGRKEYIKAGNRYGVEGRNILNNA